MHTFFDLVIDINPAKQGRFMAGSGLKISSPDESMKVLQTSDDVFVMNPNYLQKIVELSRNQFNYLSVDCHE